MLCIFRYKAGMFGDPHITTLDGKLYTFNGYGEYTLLKINTSTTTFELQARTELATAQNGGKSNATVFSAFVAQDQTGTNMQVEMSHDKKSKCRFKRRIAHFKLIFFLFEMTNFVLF